MRPSGRFKSVCSSERVHLLYLSLMSVLTRRVGNFQPFIQSTERDDGTSIGAQYGFITYDNEDNYRVTHVEMGFRCDHLYDAVGSCKSERQFDTPLPYDVDLLRKDESASAPTTVISD